MPWPPPTHMVSRPIVRLSVASPFSSVHRMRAPVIPNGCPSAMDPPCGFNLSLKGSMPSARAEGMTWAANASLISGIDIVDGHSGPPERLTRGFDRAQPHKLRLQGRDPGGDDPR